MQGMANQQAGISAVALSPLPLIVEPVLRATCLLKQGGMGEQPQRPQMAVTGAVKVVAAKSSMLKRLVFLFDSDPLVFAG